MYRDLLWYCQAESGGRGDDCLLYTSCDYKYVIIFMDTGIYVDDIHLSINHLSHFNCFINIISAGNTLRTAHTEFDWEVRANRFAPLLNPKQ